MIKGKKAGEKYLSPWLFLIWAIIGVGIVVGVIMFFSVQVNIKAEEADILAVRITDCLVDNGYLREEVNKDNIFEECNLDEKIMNEGGDFYFDILINEKEIEKGNKDLKMQCEIKKDEKHFAECRKKTIYALNQSDNGQKFIIKIIAASNQRVRGL